MSRSQNEEDLGTAIDRLLKTYGLEEGYYTAAIVTYWEKIMGVAVARRTKNIKLERGVLIIRIDSASLRQELSYAKEKIKTEINRKLEMRLVQRVEIR